MITTGRAAAMMSRVLSTAVLAGIPERGVRSIETALGAALSVRVAKLDDDHDPAYLHPGRTVLILLEDVGVTDAAVLSAAALAETLQPELAAPAPVDPALDPASLEILEEVPIPAREGEQLLERLVVASKGARLVALAERLDHARHLHLTDRSRWATIHAETCEVYLPVAVRTDPTLARRFRRWCDVFEERFLHQRSEQRSGS
ncbi:MAG: hypothetical protein FWJ74_12830 [Gemmatimonadota bacterium]